MRLACGACGHPARSLLVVNVGSAFGTHSGQDARWPHRLEALCHDSPAKHMHPFSEREINPAPIGSRDWKVPATDDGTVALLLALAPDGLQQAEMRPPETPRQFAS